MIVNFLSLSLYRRALAARSSSRFALLIGSVRVFQALDECSHLCFRSGLCSHVTVSRTRSPYGAAFPREAVVILNESS